MSVFVDGRQVVHAGDGATFTATAPDVCKTPSPGGPIPVPYPNIAKSRDLARGTKHVKIEGYTAGIENSQIKTSTGDEAGTAGGGVISGKIRGKVTWVCSSPDVLFEGKGVVRFLDPTLHNGNMANAPGVTPGEPALGTAEAVDSQCLHCGKPISSHETLKTDDKSLVQSANDPAKQRPPQSAKTVGGMKLDNTEIFAFSGGGDGKLFNLKTKKEIPLTRDEFDELKRRGNEPGNCCEQKLLRKVFIDDGAPFPPPGGVGSIKMGVAERIKGKPSAKELRGAQYKKPCGTCDKALVAMMCTNKAAQRGGST
ncbi:DUF4150 domain-containing protein [Nannocystis radixulma]|uniref:DUF4150 domain-containing protein n=1 Tax=Nannocystis radixulma TaxID=2995305 RepID=A0ABT5BSI1_9BACT|nr:DUF4150 domain-containing protein [Nannocystis radixulma]MDC0675876.1 DUF4150 domain-containing protein [Nannocystis radixulma]